MSLEWRNCEKKGIWGLKEVYGVRRVKKVKVD
jgi:copper chaperone CopZ